MYELVVLLHKRRIQPGDVVTQVNNKAVNNAEDFVKVISELKNGSIARVSLIRQGQRAIVGMRIQERIR